MSESEESARKQTVLVVGSCGLDRLLGVQVFPTPDSKVRTTSYHEVGGGNAANTATTMALLSGAAIFQPARFRIKLCSKVGDDNIGKQVIDELRRDGVDLSSPLFRVGDPGTTTGLTTVIVSEHESTRTCLHSPGTCGELTLQELGQVDVDEVLRGVVHLHSDARHTEVALALAKEARVRGIPVSIDVEKDRKSKALDELLEIATMVFTNAQQIETYLSRLDREKEEVFGKRRLLNPAISAQGGDLNDADAALFAHVVRPSAFFSRWLQQAGKEVVVTRGEEGALYVHCRSSCVTTKDRSNSSVTNQIEIEASHEHPDEIRLRHVFADPSVQGEAGVIVSAEYTIETVGVLSDATVVDSTGAGDAFIGAFILGRLVSSMSKDIHACLALGSWVGGRKLGGPGARSALPKAPDVDQFLGTDVSSVIQSLGQRVGRFRNPTASCKNSR